MTATATKFSKPVISSPPDFENLLLVLQRKVPKRPTLFEFFLNQPLYEKITKEKQPEGGMGIDRLRWLIKAFGNAGYDYTMFHGSDIRFPRGDQGVGGFRMAGKTMIADQKSFDACPWPVPDDFDYSPLERIDGELPDGMKLVVCGPGGVLENAVALVGFENLCFLVADEPEFVDDIFARIGQVLVRHYEIAAAQDTVGACISNDDWGFKTQSMLSPDNMRRFVIPWHKRIFAAIPEAGKPAILHACGNQA